MNLTVYEYKILKGRVFRGFVLLLIEIYQDFVFLKPSLGQCN